MNLQKISCIAALMLLFSYQTFAQTPSSDANGLTITEDGKPAAEDSLEGMADKSNKPFLVFDYGAAGAYVTRIQKQTGRSNFVFEDTLVGLYFSARTQNFLPLNLMARVAAYYPLYSTFNKVKQDPKQTLLYGFDLILAPIFEIKDWKYMRLDLGAGLHVLYQLTDAWHYVGIGIPLLVQAQFPVAKRWTVFLNTIASIDYGNIGTNKVSSPVDINYEYQLSIGVRYSKKLTNSPSYINK